MFIYKHRERGTYLKKIRDGYNRHTLRNIADINEAYVWKTEDGADRGFEYFKNANSKRYYDLIEVHLVED